MKKFRRYSWLFLMAVASCRTPNGADASRVKEDATTVDFSGEELGVIKNKTATAKTKAESLGELRDVLSDAYASSDVSQRDAASQAFIQAVDQSAYALQDALIDIRVRLVTPRLAAGVSRYAAIPSADVKSLSDRLLAMVGPDGDLAKLRKSTAKLAIAYGAQNQQGAPQPAQVRTEMKTLIGNAKTSVDQVLTILESWIAKVEEHQAIPQPPVIEIGPSNRITGRSFFCTPSDPSYASLDNTLQGRIERADGDVSFFDVAAFTRESACKAVVDTINQKCQGFGGCTFLFCDPTDPSYSSLDNNMIQLMIPEDSSAEVSHSLIYAFNRQDTCVNTIQRIGNKCPQFGSQASCTVLQCVPQDSSYASLDNDLWAFAISGFSTMKATKKNSYSRQSLCLQAAGLN